MSVQKFQAIIFENKKLNTEFKTIFSLETFAHS